LSIVLVATGGWALGMRGMMVTTMGEDFVVFAEAKGLKPATIFMRYCLRNAVLPQVTALALALGQILSGAVLVEVIFGYPGIGTLLFEAIRENDHFVIQGIVFTVIIALGLTTLVLDILYPWLDPRISYRRT
jgi:peptide/nickel transport system permease protein